MTPGIEQHGFAFIRGLLSAPEQQNLAAMIGPVTGAGRRGLLTLPAVAALARSARVLDFLRPFLPGGPFPVRALCFDKSPDANWLVPWHQDLTIALQERAEAPGFGPWSSKEGVPHVQPPVELLEQMLAVRIHLDDAGEANGALRVLPGSHRMGRLSASQIQDLRAVHSEYLCAAGAGDALLMRPLLLHASGRSASVQHRRVLHIEYAGFTLPPGLQWHETVMHPSSAA